MKSDKQLIREGKHLEALGDNFNTQSIYVLLMNCNECLDDDFPNFSTIKEAEKWLSENRELKDGEYYFFGNHNSDWL